PPLLELAMSCQNPDLPGNLYAISIVTNNDPDSSSTRRARQILQDADRMAEAKGRNLRKSYGMTLISPQASCMPPAKRRVMK
ncbi:MAG: hypothetical protein ACKOKH_08070, partial [Bacteroidota bacterium]